jgi:hypothetical protein
MSHTQSGLMMVYTKNNSNNNNNINIFISAHDKNQIMKKIDG